MKIIETKVMRGPNYWSIKRKKLIVMKLDLEELEEVPTNKIDGFGARLEALMPSLMQHRCSEGKEGGLFSRIKEGTWMGHVIEHIALELQTLAGMECGYGRTRGTGTKGIYNVVFNYMEEAVGGLGFINNVIIDTHFVQRGRIGRLLYACASNPINLGVGF